MKPATLLRKLENMGVHLHEPQLLLKHLAQHPTLAPILLPIGRGLLRTYKQGEVSLEVTVSREADDTVLSFFIRLRTYPPGFAIQVIHEASRYDKLMALLPAQEWLGILSDLEPPRQSRKTPTHPHRKNTLQKLKAYD